MWRAVDRLQAAGESQRRRLDGESGWLTSAKLRLVNRCNLRCAMCRSWRRPRAGELDTGEVTGLLDQLRQLECEEVQLTGGEPLLRGDLPAIVEHVAELGMRCNITSNGTLLDPPLIERLVAIPTRSITLSIDSPFAQIHDAIRGKRGALAKTVRALDRLLSLRQPATRVLVNTVVSRKNYRTLIALADFLSERPIDGWRLIPIDTEPGDEAAMTLADILTFNAQVAPVLVEEVEVPDFNPYVFGWGAAELACASEGQWALGYYHEHRCWAPWLHTLIGSTGDVYSCCAAHRVASPLGNIRDRPLAEIFSGPTYTELRRQMLRQRQTICHHCADFLAENQALEEILGTE